MGQHARTPRGDEALRTAVRDRGYTPSARESDRLLDMLADADSDVARTIERALERLGRAVLAPALARSTSAKPPLRGRLCRLVGRVGTDDDEGLAYLLHALADDDEKTRRNAIIALGKVRSGGEVAKEVEGALLLAWRSETSAPMRRSIAASLGKVGSTRALGVLRSARDDDPESKRIVGRAKLMIERSAGRPESSRVLGDVVLAAPAPVLVHCRAGLEALLEAELGRSLSPRVAGPGVVRAVLDGPLEKLFRARTMLHFGLSLGGRRLRRDESLADVVVELLTVPETVGNLRVLSDGPVRYRLSWASGGHRRALVWECARRIHELAPMLRNDPTESPWEIVVHQRGGFVELEAVPRGLDDPRFAYRVADVPAASHPSIAASLVLTVGSEPDDVVWDPFVGSAVELVERARAGSFAQLIGTDIEPRALDAARRNVAAAGVAAELVLADACSFRPPRVTAIVTNPPMGHRVLGGRDVRVLLGGFLRHAAALLAPGGRIAWVSPFGRWTAGVARDCGLRVDRQTEIDLGGFGGTLQRFCKPRA